MVCGNKENKEVVMSLPKPILNFSIPNPLLDQARNGWKWGNVFQHKAGWLHQPLHPVNPKEESIFGQNLCPDHQIPEPIDPQPSLRSHLP
jgi:hypothetical protein